MTIAEPITGIVLAGGKSTRFGRDKSQAIFKGYSFLKKAIQIIEPFVQTILISSNNPHHKSYGYPVVEDCIKNIGPLGGILSSLKESQTEKNLILSVDMPMMSSNYLKYLIDKSEQNSITVGLDSNDQIHPLCGIYKREIISHIEAHIIKEKYSVQYLIDTIPNSKVVEAPVKSFFYTDRIFKNINTADDYIDLIDDNDSPVN